MHVKKPPMETLFKPASSGHAPGKYGQSRGSASMRPTMPLRSCKSLDGRRISISTSGINCAHSGPSAIKSSAGLGWEAPEEVDSSRFPVPKRSHCAETPNHCANASNLGCVGIASASNHLRTVCGVTACPGNRWLKARAIWVGLESGRGKRSTPALRRWLNSERSCSLVASIKRKYQW